MVGVDTKGTACSRWSDPARTGGLFAPLFAALSTTLNDLSDDVGYCASIDVNLQPAEASCNEQVTVSSKLGLRLSSGLTCKAGVLFVIACMQLFAREFLVQVGENIDQYHQRLVGLWPRLNLYFLQSRFTYGMELTQRMHKFFE